MAEPSTHINYSFDDIQRYLQGKMSAAEMHTLEKAALQDPFLSDAIEGYHETSSTTAEQHLNEINAALQAEKQDSKVVTIKKNNQWLRIAAVIVVLAGIGVIGSYFFKKSGKQNQIAEVKKENIKNNTAKDSVTSILPEITSVNKNSEPVIAENKKKQVTRFKKVKRTKSSINADTIKEDEINSVTALSTSSQQNDEMNKSFAPITSSTPKNDSIQIRLRGISSGANVSENRFAGKVVDENNKPVPGAVVETTDKKAAVTDLNGNFVLQKSDSLLNVTATTIGYENKNALLKPNEENLITLKENRSSLSDVVVTGYGVMKNKSSNQTATPVGGWQNFNNYVVTKLNEDSTNKDYMSYHDIVELEFLIDNDGNPYDIHVTKSLDDERNSKAIDILKSGPRWISSSKNKKAKVAISF